MIMCKKEEQQGDTDRSEDIYTVISGEFKAPIIGIRKRATNKNQYKEEEVHNKN